MGSKTMRLASFCLLWIAAPAAAQIYPYTMQTVAGVDPSGDGGPATAALLEAPHAVAVDSSGQVYIAQASAGGVRKVDGSGNISTLAPIYLDDIAVDSSGNLYGTDGVDTVYKITSSGQVTKFAGGAEGFGGDGGIATSAALAFPSGVAVDSSGNVYIADTGNCRIREVTGDGRIQTVAGSGVCSPGYAASANGIPAASAPLFYPNSVTIDSSGSLYIADEFDVRKVDTTGLITLIAGGGNSLADGPALSAAFGSSLAIAVDSSGNVYVADQQASLVRVISPAGQIKTIAGMLNGNTPVYGFAGDGGPATSAQLFFPTGVAVDSSGSVYIADQVNARIRKVSAGVISTFAGASHFAGDGGPAANAVFYIPIDVAEDASGNLYVADYANNRIRKIDSSGVVTTFAGNGSCVWSGDGGPAASASLCFPTGVRFDAAGNLLIVDTGNLVIRKVTPAGVISTLAGNNQQGDKGDGGPATSASFVSPSGVVADRSGNVYVSDSGANRVREITPDGTINPFAGTGIAGYLGDGGAAAFAKLSSPGPLAVDSSNRIYIADQGNYRIRQVTNGVITTVAGISACCATASNATGTFIGTPTGLALDATGDLFVASSQNVVYEIAPNNAIGVIAGTGTAGFTGDGPANQNDLDFPSGLAVDGSGKVFVADRFNNRIRQLQPDLPSALSILSGDNQTAAAGATLPQPLRVQVSFQGGLPVAGVPVTFAVASGEATLSASQVNTDSNGVAGVNVTMSISGGPVAITASIASLSVTFHATAPTAVPTLSPVITAVQGAGGSAPPVTTVSSGALVSMFGTGFAAPGTARSAQSSDFVNGALPTNLANTCVRIGGQNAFLTYVSPTQINFQVPELLPGPAEVTVLAECGSNSAVPAAPVTVQTAAASPEFLSWTLNPDGNNPVLAVNSLTGADVGAAGLLSGATFTPAQPGDYLTIYAVSLGATNPAIAPGQVPTVAASTKTPATVTLGLAALPAANVLYVGASPGSAGLYQVNIQVPSLPDGNYPISLSIGAFSTPPGAYLTIQNE